MLQVYFTQNVEDVTLQLQHEVSFGNMKPNQVASYLEYKPQIYMNQETQSFESINSNTGKKKKKKKGSAMQYGYIFLIVTSGCARDITHLTDLYSSKALVSCLNTFIVKEKRALQNEC